MADFEPTRPVPVQPAAPTGAPEPAGAPSAPGPGTGGRRPGGMLRWGVALVIVALLVGVVSVSAALLVGSGSTSSVEGWIPSGTVVYLEGRADLPGDQRQNVGAIIARFPGFKDQASLDSKIDQALDKVLEKSGISWTADLKPWVGGEVGVAITRDLLDLAAAASKDPGSIQKPDRGAVLLASVKDATAATAWIAKQVGGTPATATYGGGQITTVQKNGTTIAWALRGNVLILGPEAAVKASLDTKGASPVAASSGFAAAKKSAPATYLGFGYVDTKAFYDALLTMTTGTSAAPQACLDSALKALPDWMAGSARAVDGAFEMDQVVPVVSGAPASSFQPKDSPSAVAAHLPAGTVVAFEGRQAGPALVAAWAAIKTSMACDPASKDALASVDKGLAAIGGVDSLIGWAGDAAVAVTRSGSTWGGGLAAVAANPANAQKTVDQLKALISMAGASAGLSFREDQYAGTTLEVLTLPGMSGVPDLAMALKGDLFALGTIDFVKGVLDAPAGGGLAAQAGYGHALDLAGGAGVVDVYVSITGLREGLESLVPAAEKARYDTDIKPFLEPFDSFAAVSKAATATTRTSRAVVVFR